MKNNKKVLVLISAVVILCIGIVLLFMFYRPHYRSVRIDEYEGNVSLTRQDKAVEPYKGIMLIPGDLVETMHDSFAALFVDNDKHLGVKENTKLSINATGTDESGEVTIDLSYGDALFEIENKLNDKSSFRVNTPNAVFAVRGTTFEVSYNAEEKTSKIDVLEGTVAVSYGTDLTEEYILNAGESANITGEELIIPNKTVEEIKSILESGPFVETTDGDSAVLKIQETEVDGLIHMPYYEYDYSDEFIYEMDLMIELLESNDEKAILTTLECEKDYKDYVSRIYDRITAYAIYQDNGNSSSGYYIYYKGYKFGIKSVIPSEGAREIQFALIPENGTGYCLFTRYYSDTPVYTNLYFSECSNYIFNGSYEGYVYSEGRYITITGVSHNSWAEGYSTKTEDGEVTKNYYEKGVSKGDTYSLWCFDGENVWTVFLDGEPDNSWFF